MRLRDIQTILSENLDSLKTKPMGIPRDNNNKKHDGILALSRAVEAIEQAGILRQEIKRLKETESVFLTHRDEIALPTAESKDFTDQIVEFHGKAMIIEKTIGEVLPNQNPNSLSLKLPDITDLKELSDVSTKLDVIMDQLLVNDFVHGDTKVQNFDTGSEWIEICFNSHKPLVIVASVVYAAILLKREKIKNDEMIEVVRNRRITNDTLENLTKDLREDYKKTRDQQVEEISKQAECPGDEKEYDQRINHSIEKMIELIDKGLKFFPSSKSPNDIKSLLPDFSKTKLDDMLSESKMLENSNDDES